MAGPLRAPCPAFVAAMFTSGSGAGDTLDADAKTLFHADHNNRATVALSAASLAAGRLAMVKQAEQDTTKRLGLVPKCLLVPDDLEETAVNLFRRDDENDPTFVTSLAYMVKPVPDWTDANDWVLVADPMDVPTIEIGFPRRAARAPRSSSSPWRRSAASSTTISGSGRFATSTAGRSLDYRGFYKGIVA